MNAGRFVSLIFLLPTVGLAADLSKPRTQLPYNQSVPWTLWLFENQDEKSQELVHLPRDYVLELSRKRSGTPLKPNTEYIITRSSGQKVRVPVWENETKVNYGASVVVRVSKTHGLRKAGASIGTVTIGSETSMR
jgi:hypothetical protein